jgi:hypothetical protein
MPLFRKLSDVAIEAAIKANNTAIGAQLKLIKWTPSQAKLLRCMQILNELEGGRGKEVFETDEKMLKVSAATGKKMNEAGAAPYVARLKAVLDE